MFTLQGTITALVTPFSKAEVDYAGLRENIRLQISAGVEGILPLGTTGETPTLTEEECLKIIELAVDAAAGKVSVLVGTGSNSTTHTIENTRRAKELGADCALIVTPYYNKPTQSGILAHFEAVAQAVDLPVLIYNIQGRTGVNIETDTLEKLAKLPNIIGVKEASGSLTQIGEVIERIQNKQNRFSVLSGDDVLTLPAMALGARGIVSVVSNLVPSRVVALSQAMLAGNLQEARKIHFELLPLFRAAFFETNPIPIKEAMNMCGLAAGPCRLPMSPMNPVNRDKLRQVLIEMRLVK